MGKEKVELTYDSAKEKLGKAKESLKEKREEFLAFLKENKLKKTEDHSKHENAKVAKKYNALKGEISDLEAKRDKYSTFMKENKPAKERVTKYNYPADATADDKKKFRQLMRSKAKAAGVSVTDYLADTKKYDELIDAKKKEKAAKSEKKAKKKEKEEPAEEKPKKKKKKPVVEEEDED